MTEQMHKGMKRMNPKQYDSSMKIPGGSVNEGAERRSTGKGGDDAGPGPRAN